MIKAQQESLNLHLKCGQIALNRGPGLNEIDAEVPVCQSVAHLIRSVPRHVLMGGGKINVMAENVAARLANHLQVPDHSILDDWRSQEFVFSELGGISTYPLHGIDNMSQVSDEPQDTWPPCPSDRNGGGEDLGAETFR